MTELTDLLTPAERQQMSRRARARASLWFALDCDLRHPCHFHAELVAMTAAHCMTQGLTDDEITETIAKTWEERLL